jgi:DNA-binding GntR family transcriptional regulator
MEIAHKEHAMSRRDLLYEKAYTYLKYAIINGILHADERLIETELAMKIGTSRTPVREAIHKLEQEGFVHQLPTGGHAVSGKTDTDISQICDVIGILLGYAAYLTTLNATERGITVLRKIMKLIEKHLEDKEYDELMSANGRFLDTLLVLSKNRWLHTVFNFMKSHVPQELSILQNADKVQRLMKHQQVLINLIATNQAAKAEKVARRLVVWEKGPDRKKRIFQVNNAGCKKVREILCKQEKLKNTQNNPEQEGDDNPVNPKTYKGMMFYES